ncbi:MAG: hypothetical protein ACK53L_34085, partial [Pirellulaceae bacterium]
LGNDLASPQISKGKEIFAMFAAEHGKAAPPPGVDPRAGKPSRAGKRRARVVARCTRRCPRK